MPDHVCTLTGLVTQTAEIGRLVAEQACDPGFGLFEYAHLS